MIGDMYKLPTGYNCIDIQNESTVYGYTGNRRDTFVLNGFKWTRIYSNTSNYYSCNYNYTEPYYIPSSHSARFILPAVLIVGALFAIILNWFKGIHNHV